jgi:hypothetical protein
MAPGDARVVPRGDRRKDIVDERGLADPGLARHGHHHAASGLGIGVGLQQGLGLARATHDDSRRRPSGSDCGRVALEIAAKARDDFGGVRPETMVFLEAIEHEPLE